MKWTGRKKERWEQENGFLQRARIRLNDGYRKFNRQTHGFGFLLFIIIGFMGMFLLIDAVNEAQDDAKKTAAEKQAENIATCMRINVPCLFGV